MKICKKMSYVLSMLSIFIIINEGHADWVDVSTQLQWENIARVELDSESFKTASSFQVEEILAQQDLTDEHEARNFIAKLNSNSSKIIIFTDSENITYSIAKHGIECYHYINNCKWSVERSVRLYPFQPIQIKQAKSTQLQFINPTEDNLAGGRYIHIELASTENYPLDHPIVFYRRVGKEAYISYPTDVIYRPSLKPGIKFTFRVEQGEMDDEVDIKIED